MQACSISFNFFSRFSSLGPTKISCHVSHHHPCLYSTVHMATLLPSKWTDSFLPVLTFSTLIKTSDISVCSLWVKHISCKCQYLTAVLYMHVQFPSCLLCNYLWWLNSQHWYRALEFEKVLGSSWSRIAATCVTLVDTNCNIGSSFLPWWCRWRLVLTQWYNLPEQQHSDPGGHRWRWWCPALHDWCNWLLSICGCGWICHCELVLS